MKTIFLALGISILTMMVTGCTKTTPTGLSISQCEWLNQTPADWQKLGEQDGLMGRDTSYFIKHSQGCAKIAPVAKTVSSTMMTTSKAFTDQNQQAWETGRQAGIKKYCTPLRAYQLGREGFSYQNVCPQEQMIELLKANDEGLYNYQREQNLQEWRNDVFPFDWRYGSRYDRWGYGHFHAPMPRILPNYVLEPMIKK